MTRDPENRRITTLGNSDIIEVYSGKSLVNINAYDLARSINSGFGSLIAPFTTAKQFGCVADGVTDDTVALQNAVNYAIANNIALYLDKGDYLISDTILIQPDKNGFFMYGQGFDTTIKTNSSLTYMFDINRMAHGEISDIEFFCTSGTAIVDTVVRYRWDGTGRSTTGNKFKNWYIHGRHRVGIQIGQTGLGNQVDNTTFERMNLTASYDEGDTDIYQYGIICGDGVAGNNMLHKFDNCVVVGYKNGFQNNASGNVIVNMMSLSLNELDFDVRGTLQPLLLNDVRAENSGMFMIVRHVGNTYGQSVTMNNCVFAAGQSLSLWANGTSNPNNYLMRLDSAGTYIINNFVSTALPTGVTPLIRSGASARNKTIIIDGYRTVNNGSAISAASELFSLADTKVNLIARAIQCTDNTLSIDDAQSFSSYSVSNW